MTRYLLPVAALVLVSATASALDFVPTETEWATWPEYCRARYVTINAANEDGIAFAKRVSAAEVAAQEAKMGPAVWSWIHHYCAGTAIASRARLATDPGQAQFLRGYAAEQFVGTYERVPPKDPFFGELVLNMARLYRDMGKTNEALKLLQEAMDAQPEFPSTYALAALIHRDSKQPQRALEVLRKGDEATHGASAEIHYFMGLLLVDQGDLDDAVVQARKAYDLGYPLPGLKTKLRRHNVSID